MRLIDCFTSLSSHLDILKSLYPVQRDVIEHCEWNNVICNPRQTGKTRLTVYGMLHYALSGKIPNTVMGYITDTRKHAYDLVWLPLMSTIHDLGIKCNTNAQDLSILLHNGCKIELFGCNDQAKVEKLRGYQWIALFVDEGQSIPDDSLKSMIRAGTHAGRQALRAPLFVLGTPGSVNAGEYYEMVNNKKRGYRLSTWDQMMNTEFPLWSGLSDIERKRVIDKWLDEVSKDLGGWGNSEFRREYLNEWVSDALQLMLHPSEKNRWEGQIPDTRNVISLDFGWRDSSAINVIGYSKILCKTFHLYEFNAPNMIIPDLLDVLYPIIERFKPERIIGDCGGAGMQILKTMESELRRRYPIPVEAAQKHDKAAFVRLYDSDLQRGDAYIMPGSETWRQCSVTIWDKHAQREKEGQKVDLFDTLLYGYRYCFQYMRENVNKIHDIGSPGWYAEEERRMREDAIRESMSEEDSW